MVLDITSIALFAAALTLAVKEKTLAGSASGCHEGKAAERLESEIKTQPSNKMSVQTHLNILPTNTPQSQS